MRVREMFSMAFIFGGFLAVSIFATPCAAERETDEAALKQRTAGIDLAMF